MNSERIKAPSRCHLPALQACPRFFMFVILFLLFQTDCFAVINIQSRVNNHGWTTEEAIYPLKEDIVRLKVERMDGATIRWYQIIPDTSRIYKNANHPWEKEPYKWVGLAKIEYGRKELTQLRNQWEVNPFADRNGNKANSLFSFFRTEQRYPSYYHGDVGSFWFQAVIEKDGRKYQSAGKEESEGNGISPKIFRISIREQEGYLGYLTSFFNVPGLFGSTVYQSNNYIGVDCADVLIAAYGKWKNTPVERNYNVAMIVNEFKRIRELDVEEGQPAVGLEWGDDILPGDLIAVRYSGGRQYQHIGVLYSDNNGNGLLDKDDLLMHAGPYPLRKSRMSEGAFDGHVIILRP